MWRVGFAGLAAFVSWSAGCGPSEICDRYVACQNAYDPSVDTSAYEDGGACWATARAADVCDAQCRDALFALSRAEGAPPECTDDGAGP